MIFFIVKRYHDYTVGNFLQTWARALIGKVAILSYEDCAYATRLHRGTYVFTDFERLKSEQIELAGVLADQLSAEGCRVLNRAEKVLDRVALQKKLHAAGINSFRTYHAEEDLAGVRFPCFVRRISHHEGKISKLLNSHDELSQELDRRRAAGEDDLSVTEQIDVRSPDGLFRKYGVFRCGDAFAPRHLYFSQNWVQNYSDLLDDAKLAEETQFVQTNPHLEEVRKVFDLAGTDYGRVDYGLVDGKLQVWEINTNPMMMAAPYRLDPRRLPTMALGTAKAREAIEAIDDKTELDPRNPRNWVGISIPSGLRSRLGVTRRDTALRYFGKLLGRLGSAPGWRELTDACQRARWLATR